MSKNKISIHFDGPIATNHTIQLRTFSKTLTHLQTAVDRAYLDLKYGEIWKHARLQEEDYIQTEFTMTQTRNGGFIADFFGNQSDSKKIVTRIDNAILPAYENAQEDRLKEKKKSLVELAETRRQQQKQGYLDSISYEKFNEEFKTQNNRKYGDRSIVKEFDQIASAIRARRGDGSLIEITLHMINYVSTFIFDERNSAAFHDVVSTRTLGDLIEIPVTLRGLDSGSGGASKAKAVNLISKKEFNLLIHTDRGFSSLKKYLKKRNPPEFKIVACPVLEYGAFDPLAGDMFFISILG